MATAMVRLAGDWALRHRLVRGARKTAEGLSWVSEMERLDRSYREVCAGVPGLRSELQGAV